MSLGINIFRKKVFLYLRSFNSQPIFQVNLEIDLLLWSQVTQSNADKGNYFLQKWLFLALASLWVKKFSDHYMSGELQIKSMPSALIQLPVIRVSRSLNPSQRSLRQKCLAKTCFMISEISNSRITIWMCKMFTKTFLLSSW